MDSFSQLLTSQELTQLVIVGLVLLVGLLFLRFAFKLTATLIRVGCIGIIIIVGLLFALQLFL